MPRVSASILIRLRRKPHISIRKSLAGEPHRFVHFLNAAISGNRRIIMKKPGTLVALLCSANGLAGAHQHEVYPGDDAARQRHVWRYEINIDIQWYLRVIEVSDGGEETVRYDGDLELWLTRTLKGKRTRRPGPVPKGFSNRAEYEAIRAAKMPSAVNPPPSLKEQILAERSRDNYVAPNVTGIRIISPEEHRARRAAARKRR